MKNTLKKNINELNSKYVHITGKRLGEAMYRKIVVVESKDYFYQIISWTDKAEYEYFKKDIDKAIKSFKELYQKNNLMFGEAMGSI